MEGYEDGLVKRIILDHILLYKRAFFVIFELNRHYIY